MTASTKEFQNKWMVLVAIGVGTFMTALDGSVVNTILPVINAVFHQKIASVEWIVTIYLLVLSALLLSFGRLGDMRGNKSIYVYGFVIFVIGSALCGLSPNVQYLIAFRALQATGGVVPFEVMIDATDPQTVFLEMDIFWTKAGRANPVEYLRKYRGRYRMMHLKDMKELQYFAGDGGDAGQWMALFPNMASAGAGVLDLDAIVSAALETGVEHFFVEQDMVANPETALKESLDYLKSL